jgi:outer membrane lipoprotein-sorting protein
MFPEDIVTRMLQKYASCSSYEDSGYLESFLEGEERTHGFYLKFRTWYKRPFHFRFEWISRDFLDASWKEYVVGCDGSAAFSKDLESGIKIQSSLKYAIAEANTPSRNSITQITQHFPDLDLLPIAWLDRHKDLTLIGKETANDIECYCVASTVKNPHDKIIWVSCEDYSLRRVKTYTKVSSNISNEVLDLAKKIALKEVDSIALSPSQRPEKRCYIETNYEELSFDKELPDDFFTLPLE